MNYKKKKKKIKDKFTVRGYVWVVCVCCPNNMDVWLEKRIPGWNWTWLSVRTKLKREDKASKTIYTAVNEQNRGTPPPYQVPGTGQLQHKHVQTRTVHTRSVLAKIVYFSNTTMSRTARMGFHSDLSTQGSKRHNMRFFLFLAAIPFKTTNF